MPKLCCAAYNCSHNENSLCNLNSIDVSGGVTPEDTCCNSFSTSSSASNCAGCACAETNIGCEAHDCKHNEGCSCHAENVDICKCGSGNSCDNTECSSFAKR